MVAIEQNMLYIIIAVIAVIIIILALIIRRRRSSKGPKNLKEYLTQEADKKKQEIVENKLESKSKNILLKTQKDKIKDIQENTDDTQHKVIYLDSKLNGKMAGLLAKDKHIKLEKTLKKIDKKNQELNRIIEPDKGK
jgi:type III secretory pathway component EscV